jgi:chromosome partitioning protein
VEKAVRKVLVVSQKGGIGKTTSCINLGAATAMAGGRVLLLDVDPLSNITVSLNLPQHPQRQSLRTAGVDLPGILVTGVLQGLDVLSPYEDGGCSDQDLDDLLKVLASPEVDAAYSCLIINTPPFLGANAAQLLGAADEFLLVMRVEPMAYRTMPAFLELIQRSKRDKAVEMKGILLTLPEGEQVGGRWERELRGRFGNRVLPQVIPFDEEIGKAALFGQVAACAAPGAPAACTYHSLAAHLELAVGANPEQLEAEAPLLTVAAAMRAAGAFVRRPAKKSQALIKVPSHAVIGGEREGFEVRADQPELPNGIDEVVFRSLPEMDFDEEALAPTPSRVTGRRSSPLLKPPVVATVKTPPAHEAPAAPVLPPAPHASNGLPPRALLVAVGLAVVLGVGFRFVSLPASLMPYIVPIGVGIAVSAGIVLVLRLILIAGEVSDKQSAAPLNGRSSGASGVMKKPPQRPDSKKDTHTRLANLARHRRNN